MKIRLLLPVMLLLFAAQPAFAQSDSSSVPETTLILVRHAKKADDGTSDPKLSETGLKRAQYLSEWLNENYEISAIYSTDYQRTKLTAKATAEANELDIMLYDFKDPIGFLKGLVESNKGKSILIVGHSNTTPIFANILLGKKEFEQLPEDVYDQVFIVKSVGFGRGSAEVLTY